jgi:hypothetical protein
MVPPKTGEASSQQKKQRTRKTSIPIFKETPEASTSGPSLVNFSKDYVPPRKPTTKQVKLPKETKYELVEPEIPPGVIIEGDMLGTIGNLKYADHDLEDVKKFPELEIDKYMHTKISFGFTGCYSRATGVGSRAGENKNT